MKKVERVINYLFIVLVCGYALLMSIDIIGVLSNPYDYRIVQGFTGKPLSWKSKEVLSYASSNLLILILLIIGVIVGIKKLKDDKKIWRVLYYIYMIAFLVTIFWGYYQWGSSGFDHN